MSKKSNAKRRARSRKLHRANGITRAGVELRHARQSKEVSKNEGESDNGTSRE